MARFNYDNLNEEQLRIAIALLSQEDEVVNALEIAAANAINDALEPFGLNNAAHLDDGGAAGGARKQPTKRADQHKSRISGASNNSNTPEPRKAARKPRLSADQTLSRQLQGKYIAAIRSVPKSKRAHFKGLVKLQGRQAAIDAIYAAYPRTN